ncbi:hypothetical protein ON010_g13436 [Phytophthora cinnamomi]|nr:hypothetical protein ON010_g13436 [Phytophthora cinnamomi]
MSRPRKHLSDGRPATHSSSFQEPDAQCISAEARHHGVIQDELSCENIDYLLTQVVFGALHPVAGREQRALDSGDLLLRLGVERIQVKRLELGSKSYPLSALLLM